MLHVTVVEVPRSAAPHTSSSPAPPSPPDRAPLRPGQLSASPVRGPNGIVKAEVVE